MKKNTTASVATTAAAISARQIACQKVATEAVVFFFMVDSPLIM